MRRFVAVVAAFLLILSGAGCSGTAAVQFDPSKTINLVSREDGSGTRGAFVELTGILDKATKVDETSLDAMITNNTSVMMLSVAGDPYAIGYLSLGSLNSTVKALAIDGVAATPDMIKAGNYPLSRPFLIATMPSVSPEAADFISFILSPQGQQIIAENGYIAIEPAAEYRPSASRGKVIVAGSSSVTPVMEKLKEAYQQQNLDITVEIQQSDYTTGLTATAEGISDIGMSSWALKDSEASKGLTGTIIALDGIVVVVSPQNPVDGLSLAQVREVFIGKLTLWQQIV